jgi:small subunit ribosomal protein S1
MEIGEIIQAKVTRIEPYGVWLDAQGKRGLLLITDISHRPCHHPSEFAAVGDTLTVKVDRFNGQNGDFVATRKELHPEG